MKSQREKQISYTNAYIWNLEKWYWLIYLQGSNRETKRHGEQTCRDTGDVGQTERVALKHIRYNM